MNREIVSDFLVAAALQAGKAVALPRVEAGELSFRKIGSLNDPWATGSFGIREPRSDAPVVEFATLQGPLLVITPGLAFDSAGRRLGHGKGYYDRFLRTLRSQRRDVFVVGLCAGIQLQDYVPTDDGDECVDAVCTGVGYFAVGFP